MITQRRQWLLTESEREPGESTKATDVSWTLENVTKWTAHRTIQIEGEFSQSLLKEQNFILPILHQSICTFQDSECCPSKLL